MTPREAKDRLVGRVRLEAMATEWNDEDATNQYLAGYLWALRILWPRFLTSDDPMWDRQGWIDDCTHERRCAQRGSDTWGVEWTAFDDGGLSSLIHHDDPTIPEDHLWLL